MPTFTKQERLCSKKLQDTLFVSGKSVYAHPLRVVYQMYPENTLPYPAQILVSVSKRKMKRAHDRNRLKRQIREAYRLQKEEIWYPYLQASKQNCVIAVVFTGNEHFTTEHITKKLVAAFRKLIEDDKKIISGIGFDADKGI